MTSGYKVLLVGHLFPEQMEAKIMDQEIRPAQTQRFGLALLDALKKGFDNNVEVVSAAPLSDYPHSRIIIAPYARWKINDLTPGTMMPFINLIGIKHITRFITTLIFVFQWVFRNRGRKRIIILHGVQSCKLWAVNLVQIFFQAITVSFLTDDIGTPLAWESSLVKNIRLIDFSLMKNGLQRLSGIISMTPKLAEKLAPGRPVIYIPTIRNSNLRIDTNNSKKSEEDLFTIVYTGSLSYNYGIDLLLSAFSRVNLPNWRLKITGWGELEEVVREYEKKDQRIQFLGFLPSDEISELYESADMFVTPKRVFSAVSELSFPSKIVEYLSTGKPVVSTDLPVFDKDFRKHLIICSDTDTDLVRCFKEVYNWDQHQREVWRAETFRFTQEELSTEVQGGKIRRFIDSLTVEPKKFRVI